MENEIMQIITYGGDARSKCLIALKAICSYDFEKGEKCLKDAEKTLLEAHKVQTKILQKEALGEINNVQLLMVHAQDHLMDAITIHDLSLQLIEMQKNNYKLINQLKKGE